MGLSSIAPEVFRCERSDNYIDFFGFLIGLLLLIMIDVDLVTILVSGLVASSSGGLLVGIKGGGRLVKWLGWSFTASSGISWKTLGKKDLSDSRRALLILLSIPSVLSRISDADGFLSIDWWEALVLVLFLLLPLLLLKLPIIYLIFSFFSWNLGVNGETSCLVCGGGYVVLVRWLESLEGLVCDMLVVS